MFYRPAREIPFHFRMFYGSDRSFAYGNVDGKSTHALFSLMSLIDGILHRGSVNCRFDMGPVVIFPETVLNQCGHFFLSDRYPVPVLKYSEKE